MTWEHITILLCMVLIAVLGDQWLTLRKQAQPSIEQQLQRLFSQPRLPEVIDDDDEAGMAGNQRREPAVAN